MKPLFIILASALTIMSSNAQTTQKLTATKANEYGIVYSLPKTVLDITIETETTVKEPGEFYKYAKKYLNENAPIDKRSVKTVIKNVYVTPRGIADPEERYVVTFKPGNSPYVVINSENLPVAINTEKLLKNTKQDLPVAQEAAPTPLQTEAAKQVISEEMLQSQSTAKKAELAASQIYSLRQYRTDLLTGQSESMPPDGNALQIVLDNINAQEAALTAMFSGTTQVSTNVNTITYTPEDEVNNELLTRISAAEGIVEKDDLSGSPVTISVKILQKGEMPVNEKGAVLPFPKNGFAYRIPGKIEVSLDSNDDKIFHGQFETSQFGITYGLNPNSFSDKKEPLYVILNPVNGAIAEMGDATVQQ